MIEPVQPDRMTPRAQENRPRFFRHRMNIIVIHHRQTAQQHPFPLHQTVPLQNHFLTCQRHRPRHLQFQQPHPRAILKRQRPPARTRPQHQSLQMRHTRRMLPARPQPAQLRHTPRQWPPLTGQQLYLVQPRHRQLRPAR